MEEAEINVNETGGIVKICAVLTNLTDTYVVLERDVAVEFTLLPHNEGKSNIVVQAIHQVSRGISQLTLIHVAEAASLAQQLLII